MRQPLPVWMQFWDSVPPGFPDRQGLPPLKEPK